MQPHPQDSDIKVIAVWSYAAFPKAQYDTVLWPCMGAPNPAVLSRFWYLYFCRACVIKDRLPLSRFQNGGWFLPDQLLFDVQFEGRSQRLINCLSDQQSDSRTIKLAYLTGTGHINKHWCKCAGVSQEAIFLMDFWQIRILVSARFLYWASCHCCV